MPLEEAIAERVLQAARLAHAGFQAASEIHEGSAGINRFFPPC